MFRVPRTTPNRRLLLLLMTLLQVAALLAPLLPATASRALAQEPLPEDPLDQGPWTPPPAPADPSMPLISVENPADEFVRPAETNAGFSISINTLSDEWSTDANKASSKCSLREALQATVTGNPNGNQGCGAASIGNFAAYDFKFLPGTYLLTRPEDLPDIGGNKKIVMDGKGAVTIDGGAKQGRKLGIFQVFDAELYLIKLTLQNAERNVGSAIELAGGGAYVQVTEVTFKRNFAALYGGAVSVATGEFVCIKSKFTENTARERGGALASGNGTTVVDRCDFFKNHTEGKGGAISVTGGTNQGDFFTFVEGESGLYVRDAKLYENWVRPLTPIQNPKDDASGGGAVHVDGGGHVVIERSQIYDNYTANSRGGGGIISSGVLVLLDVAISRNEARLQGVSKTFGGAILFDPSDGRLSRVSIHHNKARFAGGIYARPGTNIYIANATVSNNDADFSTGIALGSPAYGTGQDGGESGGIMRLYHSTVARNDNKFGDLENIDSFGNSSTIVLANSVIDGPCAGGPYYTGGGNRYVAREDNIALESCARVAWPALANDFSATDLKLNYALDLKLQQSTVNGGPNLSEAEFISIKGSTSSPIVDAGQAPGCTDPNAVPVIRGVDQISGARPVGPNCDSGAMEIGTLPPNFEAIPDAGQGLFFPLVVLTKATSTEQTLKLRNTGGGVIQYFAEIEPGWTGAIAPISDNMAGALGKDQTQDLIFRCTPPFLGWHEAWLKVTLDIEGGKVLRFPMSCAFRDLNAPLVQRPTPGPLPGAAVPPGGSNKQPMKLANKGTQPMTLKVGFKQAAQAVWKLIFPAQAAVMAADATADFTLAPEETLEFEIECSPQAAGMTTATLEIQTSDPVNPLLTYDLSCEGVLPPLPEKLAFSSSFGTGLPSRRMIGIALNPAGNLLLSGNWDAAGVTAWNVDPASGNLLNPAVVARPGTTNVGMIDFSPDGLDAYYTTQSQDGVVQVRTPPGGPLQVGQAFTRTTPYSCVDSNNQPDICTLNSMDGTRGLDVSPDGANVYVVGANDNSLTIFSRDPGTGALSPLEVLKNNVDGVPALTNPIGVLVSNDGQNVYVANASSNRLSVFSRTSAGYLSLIDREVNTQEGVTNMFGPFDVAESPDGQFIYTANRDGNSVSVFGRNQNDGMLTFVETIVSCTSPYAVQVSHDADGSRVFVACWEGDAVQLFTRNRETGKLTFFQQLDEGGELSFQGAVGLVSSADDRSVYVTMWADSSANSQTSVRRLSAVPPQPLLTNISPASRDVGGAAFVLTVNGLRFEPQSVVLVNGQPLATEFVTSEQLKATAPASLLAAAGNLQVAVQTANAEPSATSNAAPFAVLAPAAPDVPSIESLSPPAAPEGSQLLNVVVKGSNFLSNTRAFLNGGPVKTTFINGNTLLVELTAPDLALDGPLAISVQNVTPNAVVAQGSEPVNAAEAFAVVNSTAVRFSTAPLGTPAPPALSGFEPTSVVAGSGAQAVVVKGYNFVGGADGTVALWKGSPRPTQVVDANTLLMELTAQDLAAAQSASVTAQTAGQPTSLPLALLVRAPGSNPLPTIQGALVDPAGGFFILVTGSDFVPASIVRLNAVDQPTSYVSPYELRIRVPYSVLRSANTLRVFTPNGGASGAVVLPAIYPRVQFLPLGRK